MRGDADVVDAAVDGDVDGEGRVRAVIGGEFGIREGDGTALGRSIHQSRTHT